MPKALWEDHIKLPQFEKLQGETQTKVLIIGGGMCGILCAYMLEKAGVEYILVEANRIGSGITKNTTAKITAQHGLIYDKLMRSKGVEQARLYLEANEAAIKAFHELSKTIDCDFLEKDAFTYSLTSQQKVEAEVTALQSLGYGGICGGGGTSL